jgi:lysophospholipase L1-like esterase
MKKFKSISFLMCFTLIFTLFNIVMPNSATKAMAASNSYWIFDFGTDTSAVGNHYTPVTPTSVYDAAKGYGFEDTTGLQAADRTAPDNIRRDFVTASQKAVFKVDVPNGSYSVRIISGDNESDTALDSVTAENVKVIENGTATAGNFIDKTSVVTVSDNQLTLTFSSSSIHINAIEINTAFKPTVYIAGDSTVQTYTAKDAPQEGWGKRITDYFTDQISFVNRAMGGRSSKSFIVEGRLDEIVSQLHPNDYLFIQMGHNDADTSKPERFSDIPTYKANLKKYVDVARSKGVTPVLITPIARLNYANGVFKSDFQDYCDAMKEVAAETNTACIDLRAKSLATWTSLGYDKVFPFYMVSSNGTDYTHFTEDGAYEVAGLVVDGLKELNLPIVQYLK